MVLGVIFSACNPNTKKNEVPIDKERKASVIKEKNTKDYSITIDLDKSKTTQEQVFISSFFNSQVKTIFLETSKDASIGKIDKLQVYKDYLIVLDYFFAKKVFVFDKDGHFISTIGQKGGGPGDYSSVDDFTIDETTGNILLLDVNEQKIRTYQIETGKHDKAKDVKIENEESIISRAIEYYKGKLYADVYCYVEKDNTPLLREIDPLTGKQLQTFFTLKEYNKRSHRHLLSKFPFKRNNPSSLLFFHNYMNTVISIDENGVKPLISLTSKNSFTTEELLQYDLDDPFGDFSMKLLAIDKNTGLYSCNEFPGLIELCWARGAKSDIVFYNTQTKNAMRSPSSVSEDIVFQDTDAGGIFHPLYADKKGVYSVIDQFSFPIFFKFRDAGQINPKVDKFELLKELEDDPDPIIFYYEYKE